MINGSSILPSKTARNLGVVLDPSLSLSSHFTKLTSTLYFYIRQLRTIRIALTNDACHALVRALVLSRLDYCNGLLAKAPDYLLTQLSGVMCATARLASFSYLEKVTFLTPSVASSTGLTSRSVFVLKYAFSRVGAFTGRLLHTCLNTVFRSARSPADHTSVLPHLEICSFQRRTL